MAVGVGKAAKITARSNSGGTRLDMQKQNKRIKYLKSLKTDITRQHIILKMEVQRKTSSTRILRL